MNSDYTTKPDEIFNVWGAHPDDFAFTNSSEQQVFSMIPHFFYEFNGDPDVKVVYAGLSPGKRGTHILTAETEKIKQYLLEITKPETKLCFDNLYEGNVIPMVDKIYQAIQGTNIKPSQIYYFSCALDCDEVLENYYAEKNISERINLYGCNSWEYVSKKNTEIVEVSYPSAPKQKTFLCFNRVGRYHRLAIVMLLIKYKLIERGFCSFFPEFNHAGKQNMFRVFQELERLISAPLYSLIHQTYMNNIELLPLKLNIEPQQNINYIQKDDFEYFKESYLSLVTETYFFTLPRYNVLDEQTIFFTEKIFKPIIMKHPFIIVSRPHSLKWLRKMKYKTFHPYIDESYDAIEDDEQRLIAIINEVERLSKFTQQQWEEWQKNIQSIVEHNHKIIHTKEKYEYAFTRTTLQN